MTGPPAAEPPAVASPKSARRWVLPAAVAGAVVWAAGLGTLAATTANPPTLNREQLRRADALVWGEVRSVDGDAARVLVRDAAPAGAPAVPPGLAAGAAVTVRRFPRDAGAAGRVLAVPVRRVAGGWEVAGVSADLPRFVYAGDWDGLKAAAARVRRGDPAYR